jgi:phage-related protein
MYRAGQNVMNNLVSGIRSKISSAVSAVRSAASRIRNYFPFSPAKEGPLKDIPNWDAHLVDPIRASMAKAESVINSGMPGISTAVNNTTNTTNVGGDTFTIQNVSLSQDYPFEKFMADMARYNAQKRVQRGM